MFSAALTGVERAIGDLQAAIDVDLSAAALRAAGIVADDARSTHTFTNRTGDLESHIVPGGVRGSALAGTLEVDVLGDMPYGSYVNDGTVRATAGLIGRSFRDKRGKVKDWAAHAPAYPFLEPAWEHQEGAVVLAFEEGLIEAARRAGW